MRVYQIREYMPGRDAYPSGPRIGMYSRGSDPSVIIWERSFAVGQDDHILTGLPTAGWTTKKTCPYGSIMSIEYMTPTLLVMGFHRPTTDGLQGVLFETPTTSREILTSTIEAFNTSYGVISSDEQSVFWGGSSGGPSVHRYDINTDTLTATYFTASDTLLAAMGVRAVSPDKTILWGEAYYIAYGGGMGVWRAVSGAYDKPISITPPKAVAASNFVGDALTTTNQLLKADGTWIEGVPAASGAELSDSRWYATIDATITAGGTLVAIVRPTGAGTYDLITHAVPAGYFFSRATVSEDGSTVWGTLEMDFSPWGTVAFVWDIASDTLTVSDLCETSITECSYDGSVAIGECGAYDNIVFYKNDNDPQVTTWIESATYAFVGAGALSAEWVNETAPSDALEKTADGAAYTGATWRGGFVILDLPMPSSRYYAEIKGTFKGDDIIGLWWGTVAPFVGGDVYGNDFTASAQIYTSGIDVRGNGHYSWPWYEFDTLLAQDVEYTFRVEVIDGVFSLYVNGIKTVVSLFHEQPSQHVGFGVSGTSVVREFSYGVAGDVPVPDFWQDFVITTEIQ